MHTIQTLSQARAYQAEALKRAEARQLCCQRDSFAAEELSQ